MTVLRRGYVPVEPDVTGFDEKLKERLRRADPGGKAGKQIGGQLNQALKRVGLDPIDVKANPRDALAAITRTEVALRALASDATTVEVKIKTDRTLDQLGRFRKQLGDVGEQAGPQAAVGFAARFSQRLGPLVTSMPLSGPGIAVGAALGAAAAPTLASALSGALTAGAGAGILGAGLALVAKDPDVAAAGRLAGNRFIKALQTEATQALKGPALDALLLLESSGQRVTAMLGKAFDALGPHLVPLTEKILAAGEAIAGSLTRAAERSGPVLGAVGDAATLLGDAVSYFIDVVADGGPESADTIRMIAGATADLIKHTANLLGWLNKIASNPIVTGPLLPLLKKHYKESAEAANELATSHENLPPPISAVTRAIQGERAAIAELSKEMKAQTDPAFALLDAQNKVREAQEKATAAIRKHGTNSDQAKDATRRLAMAALDLQAKAGALSTTFDGRLTPELYATLSAAGLTAKEIRGVERELKDAKSAGDAYSRKYAANVSLTGYAAVDGQLNRLSAYQQALKKGVIPKGFHGPIVGPDGRGYAEGGWTGPGGKHEPAGVVHADEFVIKKESRRKIEQNNPGLLDEMNATGQITAGYAKGGRVTWPYSTTVAGTRIPSKAEVSSVVNTAPSFSGNWPSSPSAQRGDSGVWRKVLQLIKSGPREGSFGNSYRPGDPKWHGSGRAVDWMGYNMDALATYLASKRPLELIHRTRNRDYAYTRGRNKGSFNNALMEAHRNHIHIAMDDGGMRMLQPGMNLIPNGTGKPEPIAGPNAMAAMAGGIHVHLHHSVITSERQAVDLVVKAVKTARRENKL